MGVTSLWISDIYSLQTKLVTTSYKCLTQPISHSEVNFGKQEWFLSNLFQNFLSPLFFKVQRASFLFICTLDVRNGELEVFLGVQCLTDVSLFLTVNLLCVLRLIGWLAHSILLLFWQISLKKCKICLSSKSLQFPCVCTGLTQGLPEWVY